MDEDALGHNILLATDSYKVRIESIRFRIAEDHCVLLVGRLTAIHC